MITSEIIEDSINPNGIRLTTFRLTYQRFILSELNTHRIFSKNSASSRAVPIEKLIQRIIDNPATPVYFGKNGKGMQDHGELPDDKQKEAIEVWIEARNNAIESANKLLAIGVHKQITNRLLEPWVHMETVLTATDFDNFFELRCHGDAQPEIQNLAYKMRDQYYIAKPVLRQVGEWHLPFVTEEERKTYDIETLKKVSTARCCRVSYYTMDGNKDVQKDIELHDKLVNSRPIHASPSEHLAEAMDNDSFIKNFRGWKQYRVEVEKKLNG